MIPMRTIANMSRFITCIRVSGSSSNVDGEYRGEPPTYNAVDERRVKWGGVMMHPLLGCRTTEEGWAIILETIPPLDEDGEPDYDSIVETVAWRAPHSGNMTFPPSKGWMGTSASSRKGKYRAHLRTKERGKDAVKM